MLFSCSLSNKKERHAYSSLISTAAHRLLLRVSFISSAAFLYLLSILHFLRVKASCLISLQKTLSMSSFMYGFELESISSGEQIPRSNRFFYSQEELLPSSINYIPFVSIYNTFNFCESKFTGLAYSFYCDKMNNSNLYFKYIIC